MESIIKSKITLLFKILKDKTFSLGIVIILTIYSILKNKYYLLIIDLVFIFLILYYNKKLFIVLISAFIIILTLSFVSKNIRKYNEYGSFSNLILIVYKVDYNDDYNKIWLKDSKHRYYLIDKEKKLKVGDNINISGELNEVSKSHMFGSFNYQEYLLNKNVVGKIDNFKYTVIRNKFIINKINDRIKRYYYKNFTNPTLGIVTALTIGDKNSLTDELSNSFSKIGIGHLFVISGLHIGLISSLFYFVLKKLKVKETYQNIIVVTILFIYYILTMYMVSVLRVIISLLISKVFYNFFKLLSSLDKHIINASTVLMINPYYLFDYSFLLSYVVVLGIILASKYMIKTKKKILNYILNSSIISVSGMLISLPIAASISNEVNLLQVIFNLFYIPFVSYILLPVCVVTALFPFFFVVLDFLVKGFELSTDLSVWFSSSKITTIVLPKIPIYWFVLYYVLLYFLYFFKNKRMLICICFSLVLFIFIWSNSIVFSKSQIIFFDLPNGESTLLLDNKTHKFVLIDAGDDNESLVEYLKIIGIKRIDLLIITHGDSDHIGGINCLLNNFNIRKIGINSLCNTSKKYLSKYNIKKNKIIFLNEKDKIKIGNIQVTIISPTKDYSDINNNSLVMKINFLELNMLFCGDIEKECEEELKDSLKGETFDLLKVAHHGSSTSSTESFLRKINVKYSIAMNGYANAFSFPSSKTIETFRRLEISLYNTKDYGSIKICKKNKGYKIKFSFDY